MKRTRLLSVLIVISVIFMCMQIYFFKNAGQRHERHLTEESAIKTFVEISSSHNIPIFLVEPDILQKISNRQQASREPSKHCKYLCHNKQKTTFAVINKHWKEQNQFFNTLKQSGFSWTHTTGKDPRPLSSRIHDNQDIPLHYLFYKNEHTIHLVIFYERNSNYWWHGPIEVDDSIEVKDQMTVTGAVIGQHAGAFDKMVISPIYIDGVKVHVPRDTSSFLRQLLHSKFIECNYQEASRFLEENGDDNREEATFFRVKAKKLLIKAKDLLDQIGIRFWLSSGTCLGWYRECNTIAHSQDVDLGIWIKDYQSSLIHTFERNGLSLKHLFGKEEDSFELSFMSGDLKLDIFFFYEEDNIMWNGGTQAKTGKKFKYNFPKFTLCWTEFVGLKVRVPCETHSYIEANYGKDWNKRVRDWDWKSSPANVKENGFWPEEERPRVIQVF
ncbi:ribitol-5-phosphate transferase FKTN-like [Ptychodera flava]|uniref:ribitol-5-phosphate transferase FKTN-like n=1 Tax=Ptychodera flava TaxID=63121 RepID=UPI00396A7BEE